MAAYYVWSGATGAGTGANWANAFTTLTTAFVTEVAGDTLYVAHDHAETTSSNLNLVSSGTVSNPTKVICVNRAGSVPPVSAGSAGDGDGNLHRHCRHQHQWIYSLRRSADHSLPELRVRVMFIPSGSGGTRLRFDNCALKLHSNGWPDRFCATRVCRAE